MDPKATPTAVQTSRPKKVDIFKSIVNEKSVQDAFANVLKGKKDAFLSNLLQVVQGSPDLMEAEPKQVLTCAMAAATLDLPLQKDLGFSALVPYKMNGKVSVQFQIMTKGLVQLAQRSGKYAEMNVTEVYEDEIEDYDIISGRVIFKPAKDGWRQKAWAGDVAAEKHIAGYAAYFKLVTGFTKTEYWPVARVDAHGKKFSKSFSFQGGPWQSHREAMRKKTVLKALLRGWGPMSVMESAVSLDGVSGTDLALKNVEQDEGFDIFSSDIQGQSEPVPTPDKPFVLVEDEAE